MNKWSKILIVTTLLGAIFFVLDLKKRRTAPSEPFSTQASLPRLVDLGAGKCVPCKMMEPVLEELKTSYEGRLDVVFIDVWENKAAAEPYGIRIIPTQIFYDAAGNELFRHEGFYSKEDILNKWTELGFNFSNE